MKLNQTPSKRFTEAAGRAKGRIVIERYMGPARVKLEGSVDDVSAAPTLARGRDVPEERHLRLRVEGRRDTLSETDGQCHGTHVFPSRVSGPETKDSPAPVMVGQLGLGADRPPGRTVDGLCVEDVDAGKRSAFHNNLSHSPRENRQQHTCVGKATKKPRHQRLCFDVRAQR